MKKYVLIAILCAGLMLVTPLTGIASENKVSNNLPEYPDDVDGLVTELRVMIDEILEKYGHIPMISNLCNVILSLSNVIGKIIFCIAIIIIEIPIIILMLLFALSGFHYPATYMQGLLLGFILTYDDNCPPGTPLSLKLPLKSIYTRLETNDISDFNECPCLQE
jgi:hypothetical protein